MVKYNYTIDVIVTVDNRIINKLAHDYVARAQMHPTHALAFTQSGLTVEELEWYFGMLLIKKAQLIQAHREGGKKESQFLNRLYVPVNLYGYIGSIGDYDTPEYAIRVHAGDEMTFRSRNYRTSDDGSKEIFEVDENGNELSSYKINDLMRVISEKIFMISEFMPALNGQFRADQEGDEGILGLVVTQDFPIYSEDCNSNVVARFTGREYDEAFLQISAVLGLKLKDTSMKFLYPTYEVIETDLIRKQFKTEKFDKGT